MKKVMFVMAIFMIGVIIGGFVSPLVTNMVDEKINTTVVVKRAANIPSGFVRVTYHVDGFNKITEVTEVKDLADGSSYKLVRTIGYGAYLYAVSNNNKAL